MNINKKQIRFLTLYRSELDRVSTEGFSRGFHQDMRGTHTIRAQRALDHILDLHLDSVTSRDWSLPEIFTLQPFKV